MITTTTCASPAITTVLLCVHVVLVAGGACVVADCCTLAYEDVCMLDMYKGNNLMQQQESNSISHHYDA
jgi:hypothetical protein